MILRFDPNSEVALGDKGGSRARFALRRIMAPPGERISLRRDYPADFTGGLRNKEKARALLEQNQERLAEMQEVLYAQDRYALLIVLQAMDAAGKDGAIEHVMSGVNPQGCSVASFKVPSEEELDHDYLWRAAKALPARGMIGIFNRSYYEEVLVVRVHPELLERQRLPAGCVDENIWNRRFEQINAFERHLVENGTLILKFFLHLSKDEQRKRFIERIDEPEKNWKFSIGDCKERERWNDYQKVYQDCIRATSTPQAPWFIIPADAKWFTRLCVSEMIIRALRGLDLRYPKVTRERRAELLRIREELQGRAPRRG